MKKITVLSLLLIATLSYGQKVDLDRFYFNVSYQDLPTTLIPLEQRTYRTAVITDGSVFNVFANGQTLNDQLTIYGWKKVDDNATVTITLNIADFYELPTKIETRTVVDKDKDGKVIRTYDMYTLISNYSGKGYAMVDAPLVSDKEEVKQIEETAPKPTNRFLKSTNQTAIAEEAEENDAKLDSRRFNFAESLSYKSGENSSKTFLEKEYHKNRSVNFDLRLRDYVNNIIKNANSRLNYTYGFKPVSFQEQLWIMDSKEEEGAIQKEAIEAVKLQFSKMESDKPIDKLAQDVQPLIDYFESLKTKYAEDNKACKKIRYSAYYNLGKIYLYLDQPEKAIKEGEGLIANDYDKGDGKDIIKSGQKLIKRFDELNLRTRHNPSL